MFTTGDAALSTISHDLHRQRRSAIAPFFSKAAVQRLEPAVQSVVDKLVLRLKGLQGSGTFIDLDNFFTALTADIVFQYCFARSANLMEQPGFASDWHEVIKHTSINYHTMKHFPWVEYLMRVMPVWLIKIINPRSIIFLNMEKVIAPRLPHPHTIVTMQPICWVLTLKTPGFIQPSQSYPTRTKGGWQTQWAEDNLLRYTHQRWDSA